MGLLRSVELELLDHIPADDQAAPDMFDHQDGVKPAGVDIMTPKLFLFALRASRLLWTIGCDEVSLHDAIVNVRAELSACWPDRERFDLQEYEARLFTHCFVARRRRTAKRGKTT